MMENLKRWWWVVAIVAVVAGLVVYSAMGKAGTSKGADNGSQTATSQPGSSGATGQPGSQNGTSGAPSGPSTVTSGAPGGSTAVVPIAKDGAELATVTAIPKNTLARIKFSESRNNQEYDIAFTVYGTGPAIGGHGGLVVSIASSKPKVVSDDAFQFQGMNALLQLGPGVDVTKGGEYTGVMKLMSQSGGLVPVLTKVKAK